MHSPYFRLRWLWRLLPGLAGAVLMMTLLKTDLLIPLLQFEYRALFQLRGQKPWDSRVVVIAIDDASLQVYGRFPWPRQRYVDALKVLNHGHPAVVAIPLLFSEATSDDAALAQAVSRQSNVVLAQTWDSQGHLLLPVSVLEQAALSVGHLNLRQDSDGLARTVKPLIQDQPALALAVAQGYALTTAPISLPDLKPELWINWPGSAQQLQHYSFVDVVQGRVPPDTFRNKAVLLGVTATAIDPLITPFATTPPASSVHFHAAVVDNILQQRFLKPVMGLGGWEAMLLLGVGLSVVLTQQRLRWQFLIAVLAGVAWVGVSVLLFHWTYWVPITPVILLFGLTGLANGLMRQLQESSMISREIRVLWQTYQKDLILPRTPEQAVLQTRSLQVAQLAALAEQFGRSQSTQAAIARSLSIGLLAADLEGRVWFCNPVAEKWLGLSVGDRLTHHLVPYWVSLQAWQTQWQRLLQGQPLSPHEFSKDNRWFEMRLEPIGSSTVAPAPVPSNGFLLALEDITHRKQAEMVLRSLNRTLEKQVKQRTEQLEQVNQALHQEVEERRQVQGQLTYEASHDGLTGLPNRSQFLQHLEYCLSQVQQGSGKPFAVLFLDCNRFKLINDSFGHWMGDELLKALSKRLQNCIRPRDVLARFGGDEFTILLADLNQSEEAVPVVERIRQQLGDPFRIGSEQIFTSVSIGIVAGTKVYQHSEDILRDADIAMYQAKRTGLKYVLFEPGMHVQVQNSLRLETELRLALERGELCVYYQPIVALHGPHLHSPNLLGFEALLRWHHPERGLLSPDVFMSLAEETGLIVPIGEWVLQEACQQLYQWQQQQLVHPQALMSVNLSVTQFTQPTLMGQVDDVLRRTQLDSRCLKFELTESAIMANDELTETVFQELRNRHIQLSIDDFGTGYSSLSYLHRFPVDVLKIDRSFVHRIDRDRKRLNIVAAIINLAYLLEMKVIAEGIERPHQAESLKTLRCQYGQGYLFSRPLAPTDLLPFLHQTKPPLP